MPTKEPKDQAPLPPARFILYGDTGTRKSTMAATFPQPLIVYAIDPYDKGQPYRDLGEVEIEDDDQNVEYVYKGDDLVAEIHYYEETPESTLATPGAYLRFEKDMKSLITRAHEFKTVIFDSFSAFDVRFRTWVSTTVDNNDPRIIYAKSASVTERYFLALATSLRQQNVLIIAHAKDAEQGGRKLIRPAAYGQNGDRMPGFYGEVYYLTYARMPGKKEGGIQVFPTNKGISMGTSVRYKLKNNFDPNYQALTAEYYAAKKEREQTTK